MSVDSGGPQGPLLIACGALARELVRIKALNGWRHVEIQCLPADLHNTPDRIPGAVREKIEIQRHRYEKIFVAYADCGTGGKLDSVLADYDVERIPGAHCYEFYAGGEVFEKLAREEPGSFWLTDFLVRHFERLVIEGLGLDRHPGLKPVYFAHYRRVVFLSQTGAPDLQRMAKMQADYLGLEYVYRLRGDEPLSLALRPALETEQAWPN